MANTGDLESEVEPSCPLRRPGEGATLYVCQQDWGSLVNRDLTELNATTDTMDNEGLYVGCPRVLYPLSHSSEGHEVVLAIELRGGHRETNPLPRRSTPHLQPDASRRNSNRCD
jgi:hypothetical protein